jgi:hypothetical protein
MTERSPDKPLPDWLAYLLALATDKLEEDWFRAVRGPAPEAVLVVVKVLPGARRSRA